jgi:hypothetical protein
MECIEVATTQANDRLPGVEYGPGAAGFRRIPGFAHTPWHG